MDRWTMDELAKTDDISFAIAILNERRRRLTPYSPLAIKLQEAEHTLHGIKREKDDYLARISGIGTGPAPEPEDAGVQDMTAEEYAEHTTEMSRRALMELLAKVERPDGDPLTGILITAVNAIEELQEQTGEETDDEEDENRVV